MAESSPLGNVVVSGPISDTDRSLTFSAGKLAQLANGAVVGQIGKTVVLVTATASKSPRELFTTFSFVPGSGTGRGGGAFHWRAPALRCRSRSRR